MKLTYPLLLNAKPQDRLYKIRDRDSMYLRVSVSGSKVWKFDYLLDGKDWSYTLVNRPGAVQPSRNGGTERTTDTPPLGVETRVLPADNPTLTQVARASESMAQAPPRSCSVRPPGPVP